MTQYPNKERIKLLVDALRSGKYKKINNQLHDGKNFCTLGVACEITNLGKWVDNPGLGYSYVCRNKPQYRSNKYLPVDVHRYYGFDTCYVNLNNGFTVASMNDLQHSFEEIAAEIEATFL